MGHGEEASNAQCPMRRREQPRPSTLGMEFTAAFYKKQRMKNKV